MLRTATIGRLARQVNQRMVDRVQPLSSYYSTMLHSPIHRQSREDETEFLKSRRLNNTTPEPQMKNAETVPQRQMGENVSRKAKISILVSTLMDLQDSKEAVYSTLDAWVAWERNFPIGALKHVLITLEKEQQWHRAIQVIKWMLSKGQGTTRGTYGQLIQALDMDHRVEEANEIWKKKLAFDLHSVPWKLCKLMISVYHRNKMFEDLVKLFKGLEAFDRKPPEKSIVRKVADAYKLLGLPEEKERVIEKYQDLFMESSTRKLKKTSQSRSLKKTNGAKEGELDSHIHMSDE